MLRVTLTIVLLLTFSIPKAAQSDSFRFHINDNTLLGAVIGGVIGYQYNDDEGAVVGSLLGALAGSSALDYQRHRWHNFEIKLQHAQAYERHLMHQALQNLQIENSLLISLPSQELFVADSLEINKSMVPALTQVAQSMRDFPESAISIQGHTDSDGKEYQNRILGLQRAEAVANYLIVQGISRERLTTEGIGEAQPIAPNDTDVNKQLNNRVEIKPL